MEYRLGKSLNDSKFVINILKIICFVFAIFFAFFPSANAQNKSYHYDSIIFDIKINEDTTFDVEERETFSYSGQFNEGLRDILLNKISAISDIGVIDGETGKPLTYSFGKLDKTNPENWGKYTYYKENGAQIIEWYYDKADTKHEWILKYKVHGGLGFFEDHDELYWNLFTNFNVPVSKVEAFVKLPKNTDKEKLEVNLYLLKGQSQESNFSILNDKTFYYSVKNVQSKEPVTIYAGWPKGIIDQNKFWLDWISVFWGYVLGIGFIVGSIIYSFFYWYSKEIRNAGRGTIIPQYEPPQNLGPAMAEIIMKEKITNKAWAATIVDLAVRGYVQIKEDTTSWFDIFLGIFSIILMFSVVIMVSTAFAGIIDSSWAMGVMILVVIFMFKQRILFKDPRQKFFPKNYIIIPQKDYALDESLRVHEKELLRVLLGRGIFSTKELKAASNKRKEGFAESLKNIKEGLYGEMALDMHIFEKSISKEIRKVSIWLLLLLVGVIIYDKFSDLSGNGAFLVASLILSIGGTIAFIKYEARLSKQGHILKEDWLGFKMFLETTEKHRLQDLTPETFEKYLPYAMIFGVEKKWAKAFESLSMQSPSWYVISSSNHESVGGGFSGGGFSSSAFSASFSSSFASAFSSSTSTSGSGGGGFAGGGGGGGGGGAS